MRVIILAAGRGSRMKGFTGDLPKHLLKFQDHTFLERQVSQFLEYDAEITVVTGYRHELVKEVLSKSFNNTITVVQNDQYKEDINILSLSLALGDNYEPFTVVEADCVFDDESVRLINKISKSEYSSWYTIGKFKNNQVGGILLDDNRCQVKDIKIVKKYDKKFNEYKKLIGVLTVGPKQASHYIKILRTESMVTTKQYYLEPWIKNLSKLECINTDLSMNRLGAFNTKEEYDAVIKLMYN